MDLREELVHRRELDQAPMRRMIGKGVDPALQEQLDATIRDNTEWLRGVIHRWGWPGHSLVGEQGSDAAWLLAQHSDHDPAFQRECLTLLEVGVANRDARKSHLAYLTDRVLVNEGAKQLYGTQYTTGKHGLEPAPIEDLAGLDQRRSAMGLEPVWANRALMLAVFAVGSSRMIVLNAWRTSWGIVRILWPRRGRT